MERVLDGIRVLDLSRFLSGPYCTTLLADMGAEVIRIENVGGAEDRRQGPLLPNGDNPRYLMVTRNKKVIPLDIESPKGRDIFQRLVAKSDVVVENFGPPAKIKLGVTYEALQQVKPDIIVVTISAFGVDGPQSSRLGFDHIIQAESGAMSINGHPGTTPTRAQAAWVDLGTASYSAYAVALALLHRNKTGEGQWIETTLLDTAVSYISFHGVALEYQAMGMLRPQMGNSNYYSFSDSFAAKDGHVIIAVISDPLWRRLATLVGHPEMAGDPRFESDTQRYFNQKEIRAVVEPWVAQRTVEEVIEEMKKARVPCGKVNLVSEMVAHPQVQARQIYQPLAVDGLGEIPHPRLPIRMSRTPSRIDTPAPKVGENNYDVYCGLLGMSEADVAALQEEKLI